MVAFTFFCIEIVVLPLLLCTVFVLPRTGE